MSATQEFLDAGRQQLRDFAVLVRVSPRDPVTLAVQHVYLASDAVDTPAGAGEDPHVWLPLLEDAGSIACPGELGSTDLGLASTTLVLARSALDTSLLIDGAAVTVWLWDRGFKAVSFEHALPVLMGGVVLDWDCDAARIRLVVRQRTEWNRDLVPIEVTPEAFPQAPEDSIGQRIPIVYGKLSDVPFRSPWPEYPVIEDLTDAVSRGVSLMLGGRRAGAAVLVDTGRGAGAVNNPKARVLVASHKCKRVGDALNGCGFYQKNGDRLIGLDPVTPGTDVFNTSSGAGLLIPDNSPMAWVTAFPADVDVVANSAQNPRAVLDHFNDLNFAKLDYAAGYRTVRMKVGALPDLGDMYEVKALVAYRSVANTNLKCRIRNVVTGTTVDVALAASATRRMVAFFVANVWAAAPLGSAAPWSFTDAEIEVGWPTSAPLITGSGTAEVWFAGYAVRFRPRQTVVESERVFEHQATRPLTRRRNLGQPETTVWVPYTVRDVVPATEELRGKFYANLEGYADDGEFAAAGSFTGEVDALIERPPDVLAHQLVRYGGEALGAIEQGVGAFGSFTDARALLRSPQKRDMKLALSVGQTTDLMTAVSWVAQSSASMVLLDRFTDTWRFVPWRTDAPTDYPWKVRPEDIVEGVLPNVSRTPLSRVLTGLSLGYGYDAATGQFQHKVRLAWNGSISGHRYRGLRDEYLTVDGTNDKLNFFTNASWTATLAHGEYDGPAFAQMLSGVLKATNGSHDFIVAHGFQVVAGYNDELSYRDTTAGVDRTVALTAGIYTMEAGAAMISAAIDAANGMLPTNLTYSRTTRKMTFQRASGVLWLYPGAGTLKSRRMYATLGWDTATGTLIVGGATTITAPYERDDETLVIGCTDYGIDLLWENGANGQNGTRTNCASLCGFQGLRDTQPAGTSTFRSWLADTPKGNREQALARTEARHGPKRDTVEDLRAVADTDTAREVRNRIAALLGKPRLVVKFSTHAMPDIERGRVFEFSSDFDALVSYPDPDSDGLWTGKRFVVVEAEQFLGPVAFYTKVRAVALD